MVDKVGIETAVFAGAVGAGEAVAGAAVGGIPFLMARSKRVR